MPSRCVPGASQVEALKWIDLRRDLRQPADPEDPADMARLVEGYRRVREVAASLMIRRLCADPPSPDITDPDELHQMILREGYSVPHVVGTCAMGPSPDAGAVVDTSGCVHGAGGLLVADASIIPTAPSGFTHLPMIMLAEALAATRR